MKKFYCVKKLTSHQEFFEDREYLNNTLSKGNLYFSYFSFDSMTIRNFKPENFQHGFNGKLHSEYFIMEISDGNILKAYNEAAKLIDKLLDNVNPKYIKVYANLSAQIYIYLHSSLFGDFPCSETLMKTHSFICQKLSNNCQYIKDIYASNSLICAPGSSPSSDSFSTTLCDITLFTNYNCENFYQYIKTNDLSDRYKIDFNCYYQSIPYLVDLKIQALEHYNNNTTKVYLFNSKFDNVIHCNINKISQFCNLSAMIYQKITRQESIDPDEIRFLIKLLFNFSIKDDHIKSFLNQLSLSKEQIEFLFQNTDRSLNCSRYCKNKCQSIKAVNGDTPIVFLNDKKTAYEQSSAVEKFISLHKDNILYKTSEKAFYVYDSELGFYKKVDKEELLRIINLFLKITHTNRVITDNTIESFYQRLCTEFDLAFYGEFNSNPYLINLANGVYDLINKEFLPHSPDYKFNKVHNYNYNPNADCPLFKKTLKQIFPSKEVREYVLQLMCYLFIPNYDYQKIFIFYGKGRNGKSLIAGVIRNLLGEENVSSESFDNLADDKGYSVTKLVGKLVNISSEIHEKCYDSMDILKRLSGGDKISCREIYQPRFEFINYARLIFLTNNLPNIKNIDLAIKSRLVIIEFPNCFDKNPDTNLLKKLKNELSGIFNLVVSKFPLIIDDNRAIRIQEPNKIKENIAKYLPSMDNFNAWLEDRCSISEDENDKENFTLLKEAYDDYRTWCTNNKFIFIKKGQFTEKLKDYSFTVKKEPYCKKGNTTYKNEMIIVGLKLKR